MKLELTPDLLDTLWGYYYATGNYRPLSRIILMLRWSKERDAIERLTLGSMAKYTLAINSARNADLLANLKWAAGAAAARRRQAGAHRGDRGRRDLRDRQAAQRRARLDRGAASARAPATRRDISLWGQVGEGAIAIGCIAAAVAGQVEFGIPCVVGGAATSAALRIWDGQN